MLSAWTGTEEKLKARMEQETRRANFNGQKRCCCLEFAIVWWWNWRKMKPWFCLRLWLIERMKRRKWNKRNRNWWNEDKRGLFILKGICLVMTRDTFFGALLNNSDQSKLFYLFYLGLSIYKWNKLWGGCRVHLSWTTCPFNQTFNQGL